MNVLAHAEQMLKLVEEAQQLSSEAEKENDPEAAKILSEALPMLMIELHLRAILDELRDMNKTLKEKK